MQSPAPEDIPVEPASHNQAMDTDLGRQPKTPATQIEQALSELQASKSDWAGASLDRRLAIIERIQHELAPLGSDWVEASVRAKGLQGNRRGRGEEWSIFAIALRTLQVLHRSLKDIRDHGRPQLPKPLRRRHNGQVVADVFPATRQEALLHLGVTAEVWMQPEETPEQVLAGQAQSYRQASSGKVVAVLGAGNVASLITTDVLYKIFVENAVVLLKPNPVNDYLGPILERGLSALIEADALRIAYGGANTGSFLAHHPMVDEIHLTGSLNTFESIIFGDGAAGARRKEERQPQLDKPVTAELGNITPVIIVPGPWSQNELEFQASQLAAWFVTNSSFNCLTPRVIVQQADWPLREPFLEALAAALRQEPARDAYYPGANDRFASLLMNHPEAEHCGPAGPGQLPWTLIRDLDPEAQSDPFFREEPFCSLIAETGLTASGPADFLAKATEFANETLWGTLTASILAHPKTLSQPGVNQALEQALERLRYGMISVNMTVAYAYYVMVAPWGSFPGQPIHDAQSGIGAVNNFLMFDRPQKSIVRGPFRQWPDFLSLQYDHLDQFGQRLAQYEADGGWQHIPGLFWTALKS